MMRALREAKNLITLRLDHNIIGIFSHVFGICICKLFFHVFFFVKTKILYVGPAAGKDISSFLKNSDIKVFTISYNSLGEIARFPTLYTREKISSSVHDIFLG